MVGLIPALVVLASSLAYRPSTFPFVTFLPLASRTLDTYLDTSLAVPLVDASADQLASSNMALSSIVVVEQLEPELVGQLTAPLQQPASAQQLVLFPPPLA